MPGIDGVCQVSQLALQPLVRLAPRFMNFGRMTGRPLRQEKACILDDLKRSNGRGREANKEGLEAVQTGDDHSLDQELDGVGSGQEKSAHPKNCHLLRVCH